MADKPESPDSSVVDLTKESSESESDSTGSSEDDTSRNNTLDMIDAIKKIGERRGPIRPMRPPFVVPSVSSADTSVAVSEDTLDDDNSEDTSMNESILRRVLLRRMEGSPMKPLVLTPNSTSHELDEVEGISPIAAGETGAMLAGTPDGLSNVNKEPASEQSH